MKSNIVTLLKLTNKYINAIITNTFEGIIMLTKTYQRKEIKKLIKQKPVPGTFNIFDTGLGIIKIYKDVMADLLQYGTLIYPFGLVNPEQIEWLVSKQSYVKGSKLPNGIVYLEEIPIGVMYPEYFKGYSNFDSISEEETPLMMSNFRLASDKNIELVSNGIFNVDLSMQNILYKGNNVELVDLDGKYIYPKESYIRVYSYFVYGMMKQIYDKISTQYPEEEAKRAIKELQKRIDYLEKKGMTIEYPHQVLDEVEKSQILRLK